jgi:hypothetical protein
MRGFPSSGHLPCFDTRGVRQLEGLGEWPLYAVSALGEGALG